MNKKCTRCKIEKDIKDFPKIGVKKNNFNKNNSDKYDKRCRKCKAEVAREWRLKNPGYRGTGDKAKYIGNDKLLISAIRTRITEAKSNNKRHARIFDIDAEYMFNLFKEQNGKCYLTNLDMAIEKKNSLSLSIDKVKPELGYTKGNVKWSCWMANRAKGDLSIEQLEEMCKAILIKCNDYRKPNELE